MDRNTLRYGFRADARAIWHSVSLGRKKVSAQVRRKSWDQSNDNLVEDDVNYGNARLNEDMIVAAEIAI